ncbi:flavodoxin family protein [Aquibacillus koreensis]|uniref:Flavodoxin family protein n=1 Tax=Aquibacillus koreensis TaxID=279446 RepID=A0A9X3WIQ6_9BACI|nr:flavodoxin family protein [Aquibacillus koreensis]MCT2535999.1 flavodoxin family protein [Aquibacillus koreensis]MDC3420455.1 flavodoxin family protein [Aquibacillus koreensis]
MKAIYLNTSLKTSDEESNTSALIGKSRDWLEKEGIETEELRITDYHISFGMKPDMGDGDEWPIILKKVSEADIIVIGTPIWIGEKSSVSTLVMERLYASSAETNEHGQSIYYNKAGGAIVTGNEDGAKESAKSIIYGLQHIGFTIPPNVDAYWVGEAGPGPSFIESGQDNNFTQHNTKTLSYNLIHFARLLKKHPIPAQGNLLG